MTRDERQDISVQKIVRTNCLGTVEAVTGFGKTRIATNIINLLRRDKPERKVVVVVPTIQLKLQWEEGLESLGFSDNSEVYVINSLIKLPEVTTSLLILDEIHRYAAETFSRVFDVVKYSFILGLTATLKRLDGKHALLKRYAPICDKISMGEAKRNGWLAPYTEYNLAVEMNDADREQYMKMGRDYGFYSGKFNSDFELMKNCSYGEKPFYNGGRVGAPSVVQYARSLGWVGNTNATAWSNYMHNQSAPRGHKVSVWGNEGHPFSPAKMLVWAIQGMRTMRAMKEFVQNYHKKIVVAENLIRRFNRKTITFCETISVVDELAERLGSSAVIYHSQMKGGEKRVRVVKEYKTQRGADNFVANNPEWSQRTVRGVHQVYKYEMKKIGASEMKREALRLIAETKRTKTVCTAKALDQGFDFPGAELGVSLARTSSPTQQIQRTGRIVRKHTFDDGTEKRSTMVNIYVRDTKDEKWLQKAQRNSAGVIWVSSVDEVIDREFSNDAVGLIV